jgi:glycosyltransferase involved in cell wall biosynthesis
MRKVDPFVMKGGGLVRIIAILATYNEERFIAGCLEHLFQQGAEVYLIDNSSTDQTVAIAERYIGLGLIGIETFPRDGVYKWRPLLERKEQLAATLQADWFMHIDADEMHLPPRSDYTLAQAFAKVEAQGYNAVNFLEFTFIPTRESPDHDHPDFQKTMCWYYPFLPTYPNAIRAWKHQPVSVELAWSGGHQVRFPGLRMYPESFRFRHYLFLSVPHAIRKYINKRYNSTEAKAGWHGWRAELKPEMIKLPKQAELRTYISDDYLDASNPHTRHYLDPHPRLSRVPYLNLTPLTRVLGTIGSRYGQRVKDEWDRRTMTWLQKNTLQRGEQPKEVPAPFIVGMGRSGTTLLRLMLDAHPDLAIPPETHFIPSAIKACRKSPEPREAFLQALTSYPMWEDHHIDIKLLRQKITAIEPFDLGDALRTFYRLYAERFNKPRWGDKSAYLPVMCLVQELLPEARFVHIIRDGRDVALSIKDLWWGPNSVKEAAKWWVSGIERARNQAPHLRWYLEVRYEDLVLDTESTLRRICDFIDLPWDETMLEYDKRAGERLAELTSIVDPNTGRITTAEERRSIHSLLSKPPEAIRVGRWKIEMTDSDQERFKRAAGEMLRELGYDTG